MCYSSDLQALISHTFIIYVSLFVFPLGKVSAQNGFVVGISEEGGTNGDGDVYPDGPLQSGTQSLRRISTGQKSKV